MTIFVEQGDAPLDAEQLMTRTQDWIARDWPEWQRQRSIRLEDGEFNAYMAGVSADTDINRARNDFNIELDAYRRAVERLARYRLADGRPAIMGEGPDGEPLELCPAIDPLPATIEVAIFDDETGEAAGTATVTNPAIVADDAERAAAQDLIDTTPTEVRDFDDG